jgi:NAD(P)-dependent dehydrogenase (short-subunit alcohol dehydrogenase family)
MNAVILGGSGGIGMAFIRYLKDKHKTIDIHATFNKHEPKFFDKNCHWHRVDVTQEAQIENFCTQLDEVDLCINAVGMLHDDEHGPEKSTRQINQDYFLKSMSINSMPTLLLAKHMAAHFKHKRPAVFATVSARVGSIEENYLGGWYSYRASKAALNMILKTLSIEWKRSLPNVAVAALHPGTTDTGLSRPFQQNVAKDHLFSAEQSVNYMMQVIDQLSPDQTGKFWSFDGEILPW